MVLSLVMAVRVVVSGVAQDEHGGHPGRRDDRHDHGEPDRPASSRLFAQPPALLQDRLAELDRGVGPQRALNRPPILVDERVPVETQELGVGAQEPLRVRVARENLPLLVLERPQVLGPDLGPLLDRLDVDLVASARPLQHLADRQAGCLVPGGHEAYIVAVGAAPRLRCAARR